ncbi:MAG: hypothetical protein GY792_31165 [Gammaproteobacteria bacterium]|nr:hypothetical protein [Gammaproteobacteria bacterium]
MKVLVAMLLGLSSILIGQVQATTTEYQILFSATQGPNGTGSFSYDDTPGLERMSDVSVQFGPSLSGTILTPTPPPPFDDDEAFFFEVISDPDDIFRAIWFDSNLLSGFDTFNFFDEANFSPPLYEFEGQGITGAGSVTISTIPIPALRSHFFAQCLPCSGSLAVHQPPVSESDRHKKTPPKRGSVGGLSVG